MLWVRMFPRRQISVGFAVCRHIAADCLLGDNSLTPGQMMWQGGYLMYWRLSVASAPPSCINACHQHPFHEVEWWTTFVRNLNPGDLAESLIESSIVASWFS